MKSHLRLRLSDGIHLAVNLPYWQTILDDKASAVASIHPSIDALFAKYQLPFWATQEYQPADRAWSHGERLHGLDRFYRLILQEDREIPPRLIEELAQLPIVESAQVGAVALVPLPSPITMAMGGPDTDLRSRQAIYLERAHQFTQGDPQIIVAVLDTGVTLTHPEYKDVLLPGRDFVDIIDGASKFVGDYLGADDIPDDEVGHGTHVTGIIASQGLAMPIGVVPKCRILPVRVLAAMDRNGKKVGAGLVDNINAGIKWAVDQGAHVINMSLGIPHTGGGLPHQEVVDYAKHKGVTIVAASGNDGQEALYYPGALPHVIAVGAFSESGSIANFSTYGKQVSLVAPGTNIYSTYLDDDYSFSTGTSHASPFVAGAVALLKSYALKKQGKILSDGQIKHILKHTADKVDTRFKHRKAGFGRLNLIDAVKLLDYKLT
jgi:thermitase